MIGSYVCGLKSALFLHTDKNHFFLLEITNYRKTIAFYFESVLVYYPACACASRALCDRGWCPYICLWSKKKLSHTLAIDSPFQTFAVGLFVEFID